MDWSCCTWSYYCEGGKDKWLEYTYKVTSPLNRFFIHIKLGFMIRLCISGIYFLMESFSIGYDLNLMIVRGVMLSPNQPVILHMLDIPPAVESLNGVKIELLNSVMVVELGGTLVAVEFGTMCMLMLLRHVLESILQSWLVVSRKKEGMERKDVMSKNVCIYKFQDSELEKHDAAKCKVIANYLI
ncbi:malate dehydrogenase, cytoplasmic-like [Vicia villosa]|uniref:malate dehydrogenase, cytoplasmic-like n=1 Tax=Vicia villosa TaxID=3911 RepID=UPI00273B892A|nr:malate dehydrogenase, cytoplasmic-like [Vicia villosa]